MPEWPSEKVEDCLKRLSLSGFSKLQTKDYKPVGRFPIIDQGQSFIAGWTDDDSGVISSDLPVIVFGDHTRVFKYVDFPFVRGADGTQVLKPSEGIDCLYFYFACQSIDLQSRGYNRHFSILREQSIPIPSHSEQLKIGAVLRAVEKSLSGQSEMLSKVATLKRAAMRELFTCGLRGKPQIETDLGKSPEDWFRFPIERFGQIVTGTTPPTKDATNYVGGEIPFIAPGDFEHGTQIIRTEKKITDRGLSLSRPLRAGTTCFVCIGSTIGKVGLALDDRSATNQQINAIIPSDAFDDHYVYYLMTYWSDYIRKQASPSPVPILSKGAFEQIEVFTSVDKDEQVEIVEILDAIDRKIDLHKTKHAVLEDLFRTLLHKLMTGDVPAADLALSALGQAPLEGVAA